MMPTCYRFGTLAECRAPSACERSECGNGPMTVQPLQRPARATLARAMSFRTLEYLAPMAGVGERYRAELCSRARNRRIWLYAAILEALTKICE